MDKSQGLYKPTRKDKKLFKDMSVCVVTPCYDYNMPGKHVKCMANMIAYSWMHGLKVYNYGQTNRIVVDWARNALAKSARDATCEYTDKPYTHMLWLDDDMLFNPDLALCLARHNVDMVSGLYFARLKPFSPSAYVRTFADENTSKYTHYPLIEVPPILTQVDATGFGAMFMKCDLFREIPEPWFTLDYKAGEDIAFCVKAKENGYKIYIDGSYKLGHIGESQIVSEATFEKFRKDHPGWFQNAERVECSAA